jgi:hypothetical protein
MNRNVFARRPAPVKKAPKVEPVTNSNVTVLDTPYVNPSGKHNPDVMANYEKIKNRDMKNEKIDYSKDTWKTITNEEMDFNPDVSSNFICAKDARDYLKIKSETENAMAEREAERLEELRQLEEIKAESLELCMQMEDEICGDDVNEDTVIFNELKISAEESDSSELKSAKDDFNALLSGISKL